MQLHYELFRFELLDVLLDFGIEPISLMDVIELFLGGLTFIGFDIGDYVLLMLAIGIIGRVREYVGVGFVLIV